MEARTNWLALSLLVTLATPLLAQRPFPRASQPLAQARSQNFHVVAPSQQLADEVAQTAEQLRADLGQLWLGDMLPNWPAPCPIVVNSHPQMEAQGRTSFTFKQGTVGGWDMEVSGTRERILDSVLPHEITHTIFATHFAPLGKPVPRWADEGACTTVEHLSERSKHDKHLVKFLAPQVGQGLPFAVMFSLRDYPMDPMPLYAQGYSVTSFLIAQVGHRNFVKFLEDGMQTEDWVSATEKYFGYPRIGKLQVAWNAWVAEGGGEVDRFTAAARGFNNTAYVSLGNRNASGLAQAPNFDDSVRLASSTLPTSVGNRNQVNPMQNANLDPPSFNDEKPSHYQQLLQSNGSAPGPSFQAPGGQGFAAPSELAPPPPTRIGLSDGQTLRKPIQDSRQNDIGIRR